MRTTKRIIIRIIVAVGVAFILSKLRLLGVMEVNALSTHTMIANQFCVQENPNSNIQCDSVTDRTYFGRPFKSYTYLGDNNLLSVGFRVQSNTSSVGKPIYLSGLFLVWDVNTSNGSNPIRAYINTGNRNIACNVEYGTFDSDVGYPKLATFTCQNVLMEDLQARIWFVGPFANYNTLYAIGNVTALYNDNLELLQQANNQKLEDLKSLINNSNNKLDLLLELQRQQNQTQQQIQNNTKETNDLIKNDSSISNDKITDITNIDTNTTNTPVSDFITLPITLLGRYREGITGSCSPVSLGSMYGYNFVLPCINISSYIGNDLWHLIDMMISFFLVYKIAMMCLKIFEDLTSLKDPFDEAYSPKHVDNGKHGEV